MLLNLLLNCAFICVFCGNSVLTIVLNGGIKTKIYHHDSQFLPTTGTTTHNNQYIGRNYDDDSTITYNQGSTATTTNNLYENLHRHSNYKQPNNERLQGQHTNTHNSLIDNSNAIYVENNIISHRSECPPGETGQFPYMYDCRRFLNCWKGRGYVQACAPGTVFNPRSLECDSPQKVNCLVGDSVSAHIQEYPNQSIPRTKIINDIQDGAITCSPGTSGLKPHPFECNKFLQCDHGRTFIQTCGPGTVFNPLVSVCDFPYNVDCGEKIISSGTSTSSSQDSTSSGSNINYNIRENHNVRHSQQNFNQYDGNRNPKQYNGHGSSYSYNNDHGLTSGHSQITGYGVPGYSPNDGQASSSSSGFPQTNGHNNGYSHISNYPHQPGYPHQSSYPQHSGYPQPHRHHGTQTTIPVWPTTDSKNPSTNYYPINNNGDSTQTTTTRWDDQQQHSYSKTTTRRPSSWRGINRNDQPAHYQPNQHPKSVYDKPYDINKASVHEFLQNNNLDNNSTTKIYYATPVEYNSDEIFGKDDNTSLDLGREDKQKHIPINFLRESTTTTTTTVPPVVKYQPYPTYDHRVQEFEVKNNSGSTTPKTKTYYDTPVEYNPEESFRNIDGGDIPFYDPFHENPNEDKTNSTTKPIYPIEPTLDGILIPANHLLPPHHPITTPTYNPSFNHYPNDNNTNKVRIYPIYPITKNNHNSTLKENFPSISSSYSGISYTKKPIKPYEQTYLPSGNLQAPFINNQIPHTTPSIIFNHNDGVILSDQNTDESLIAPIYVRPTRPTTILYSTEPLSRSVPSPSFYNQITTSTVATPIFSTTEQILDVDKDTEDLPFSEALKILLRPYVNKNENISDQAMKKLESHIMKIENNQAKENIKKQVEIIVTGEQEHMANRSFHDDTTARPNYHHHINHHHTHGQHSREFHRTHPNLPNPFESSPTAIPKTIHPDAETVSINRRVDFNPPVNRNPPVDIGQKIIPIGHVDGTAAGAKEFCQFDCGNGKCIKHFEVCDGVNNCGNRKDEQKCDRLGYEIRLANNSNSKHKGRIEIKVNGKWGYVCDDKFDMNDANVVCRELGFPLGASEIRGNSYYLPTTDLMSSFNNVSFVMDELDCVGNETSVRECDFKGWGVHDCNADEVVGVVCKIPIMKCPHDYWLCATSMECIPPNFVCDNTVDCSDGSDESNDVCKSKIEYRLVNGKTRLEGRVEIKYRNEWGTICDDDFGKSEAAVVCRNLGYYGLAEVIKNTYGSGNGPIWLDQISCFGNETCLDQCTHWKWGENNCNHSEDVSIRCSIGSIRPTTIADNTGIKGKTIKQTEIDEDDADDLDYLFYNTRSSKVLDISKPKCGYYNPDILDEDYDERQMQRIVHGNVARLGRHPWQATIRVKGVHGMSSHLCGAVLISRRHLLTAAHCISDYEKGAFFIRLGDHRTDRKEDYEKDVFIHDWYIHENYRKINHMNNDIALIVIKEPVQFSDYIQPICLPDENVNYDAEKICTISGWGSDRTGQSAPSKVLRAAEVPILSNEVCKKPEVYGRHITDGMFCAGFLDGKFDACDGDSGGPMACTDGTSQVLYGITSWGLRCGHENKPGVYVKISQYVEWIKRKINHSIQSRNK